MNNKNFYELMDSTFNSCRAIAKIKGEDYTKGSLDALANFKEGGAAIGADEKQVAWVFMNKHYQAITNYVKTNGKSQSEPIDGRIDDMINYLVLFKAIVREQNEEKTDKDIIDSIKSGVLSVTPEINVKVNSEF